MTIDVIIPAYNCSRTLGRTLASLAAQTDRDFRLTIVDDCSTEDLNPIIYEYRNGIRDMRVIRKTVNEGQGMARQTGIDKTDGEWICFLDADDLFMPYTIEVFKLIIEHNPDMNMLHSTFLQQSALVGNHGYNSITRGFTWLHGKLYRRSFLEEYGIRNDPQFSRWADDSYFNAQCSELTPITMNELPMYIWTDTDGSITRKDYSIGRKNMKVLIDAMYTAGLHTLQYKDSVGHLKNTIGNINDLVSASNEPLTEAEAESFEKLLDLYEKHGIKPEEPKPKRNGIFTVFKRIFTRL